MKRVRIEEPEKYLFKTNIVIRASDLNYGNHLSNDCFLKYAQEARMQFFQHFGYTELQMEGLATIMADCEIQFLAQGYYSEEVQIEIGIGDYSRVGFNLIYRFYNLKSEKAMALIKTGILCFSYKDNKVKSVPEPVWRKFGLPNP
jgi:acyl-CoA thioesterase FadM